MENLVKNVTQMELFPQEGDQPVNEAKITIDQDKIDRLEKEYDALKLEISTKEYVVKMTPEILDFYIEFMANSAPWKGKEALGVFEINQKIREIKADGIKNGVVFMKNLHIEAGHYFLTKYEGKGYSGVESFVSLIKAIENALVLVGADNKKLKDVEKELHAAQQGLEME